VAPAVREQEIMGFILRNERFNSFRQNVNVVNQALADRLRQKPYFIDFRNILTSRTEPVYQADGVQFALFKRAALIGDEMGLGKTLQAIALAVAKKEVFGFEKVLVITPASLKEQWKREIDNKVTLPDGSPLPVILLANKADLPDSQFDKAQLDAFCKEHGFICWMETSAKANLNIEEAVKRMEENRNLIRDLNREFDLGSPQRQIELLGSIGKYLDHVVRKPIIRTLVRLARRPAHAAGFGTMQEFLERGLDAFEAMHGAGEFLATLREREVRAMERMFAGTPDPFEFNGKRRRAAAK
jgi:hypothetical protein